MKTWEIVLIVYASVLTVLLMIGILGLAFGDKTPTVCFEKNTKYANTDLLDCFEKNTRYFNDDMLDCWNKDTVEVYLKGTVDCYKR